MFRPKKMRKARIVALKSCTTRLIKDLHEAGIVDIRKTTHKDLAEGRPLVSFDEVSAQLIKLRVMHSVMSTNLAKEHKKEHKTIGGQLALDEAKKLEIGNRLKRLSDEAVRLEDEMKALELDILVLEKLLVFKKVDFSKLRTNTINYKVGKIDSAKALTLNAELEKQEGESTIVSEYGSDITLVLYEKRKESDVEELLTKSGFHQIDVPAGTTTPAHSVATINAQFDTRRKRLKEVRSELADISEASMEKVGVLLASLEVEAQRAEITSKFSSSDRLYVLEGWILEEDFPKLTTIVEKYENEAMLTDIKYGHDEKPPTVLANPPIANPFAFLTKNYSLPNYFELDPTMAYFIGLPIIYGMIVGDFIYGILSIVFGYLLMKKFKKSYIMRNVSMIWFYSGFVTLIFGFLFDEWMGMSHLNLINFFGSWIGIEKILENPLYPGFHRIPNIAGLIAITAFVGMIHLAFGFVLGAINEWNHNRKHAMAKVAWLGVELSLVLMALAAIGWVESAFTMVGVVLLVLCVIALYLTEGLIGIIELPGFIGNIFSYTRIAAIGVVGVVIAEFLVNMFLLPSPDKGLLVIILLPVFFILHIVNAFLAMFESLVQGGRLNIIEFRSKFLHGGGEIFSPFSLKNIEVK